MDRKDFLMKRNNGRLLYNQFVDFIKDNISGEKELQILKFENYYLLLTEQCKLSNKIKLSAFKQSEDATLIFIDQLINSTSESHNLYFGSMKFEDVGVLQFTNSDSINFIRLINKLRNLKDDGLFIFCNQGEQYKIDVYFNDDNSYDIHFHSYEGSILKIVLT